MLAFAAEAKYDSLLLDIISFASACALLTRIVLGYRRMSQRRAFLLYHVGTAAGGGERGSRARARRAAARFEQMASAMLADTTIAGQEAAVDYLAGAAALEQWAQAALALLLLRSAPAPLSAEQLAAAVEALLEQRFQARPAAAFWRALRRGAARPPGGARLLGRGVAGLRAPARCAQVRIRFAAEEALGELRRLGLLAADDAGGSAPPRHAALAYADAFKRLNAHWDSLLLRRMGSILSTVQ